MSRYFSGNLYFIDKNETATLTGRQYFHTLVNGSTAVVVTVKGGGVFEKVAEDAGTGTHLDASGVVLGASHAAGFYEAIGTQGVALNLGPNQIVCGRFTEVAVANTNDAEVHAYTG